MNRFRQFAPVMCGCLFLSLIPAFTMPSRNARVGSITASASMLEPRSGHSATLLRDGRVLIAGGMRRNQDFYRSAEIFDPARNKFESTGSMTEVRVSHIAVLLKSGKVLIAGGWIGMETTASAELYDPATRKFTRITSMTSRRARPTATLLDNGDVLIAGGQDRDGFNNSLSSAEIFHASTMTFARIVSMHEPRIAHTATLLRDGRVLIAGGRGSSVTARAEIFDPKTNSFSETGSLATARYKATAAQMADGRVLIAGGSDERDWKGTLSSAEVFDPRTGKFSATAAMGNARFKLPDEAVRLANGEVLIAGGSREVEIYRPESGTFKTVPGTLSDNWHYMSETMLKDGSVLLAGGYPNNDRATSETWIYRP
jgi:hypothetical protein